MILWSEEETPISWLGLGFGVELSSDFNTKAEKYQQ